ncbi:MAG: Na/Pi cotransporter family protein [Bacteroidales bacterium]|jgi:phosphate:Na+ symporter|nr:Na/Pi cotransporter family protein [Bacteroidales bacterium]
MQFGLLEILRLVGSLVLFLFGMRMMSEALQKAAGHGMRNILRKMTKNHFTGIVSGFFLTALIQSSSASTVMFISFVNAGLLSFTESISLIIGANIGTTITSWLVAILGFKFDIVMLCLPLIAVSFPFIFSKKNKWRTWGEVIVGFSLLFLALDFLKAAVPDINNNPHLLEFLSNYQMEGLGSILIFVLAGFILTLIIQSSSATLALIVVMCGEGWIGFELGVAMVIGVNIGTTITANIAALIANRDARKSAMAHSIFNVFGAIIAVVFFSQIVSLSDWFTIKIDSKSALENTAAIPMGLAVFHTMFNVISALLFAWFIEGFAKSFNKIYPSQQTKRGLRYINTGLLATSELSLLQARKEILNFGSQSRQMFNLAKRAFHSSDKADIEALFNSIETQENAMDEHEIEIAKYLSKVSENDLSLNSAKQVRSLMKINDNIESIADDAYNMGRLIHRKSEQRIWFTPELRQSVNEMFSLLDQAFSLMLANLQNALRSKEIQLDEAYEIEHEINSVRNFLKQENIQNINKKEYRYQAGVMFLDLVSISETMADHLINISESLKD